MPARRSSTPSPVRVALLRGVNVGAKQVAMADLRAMAARLGFTQVSTLINSGNLVYRSATTSPADDVSALHEALARDLGVRSTVFVRTVEELQRIVHDCPLQQEAMQNPSRLLVTVYDAHVTAAVRDAFVHTPVTVERFVEGPEALYCWLPDGLSASKPYEQASKHLGHHVTGRNWATVQKLLTRALEVSATA